MVTKVEVFEFFLGEISELVDFVDSTTVVVVEVLDAVKVVLEDGETGEFVFVGSVLLVVSELEALELSQGFGIGDLGDGTECAHCEEGEYDEFLHSFERE